MKLLPASASLIRTAFAVVLTEPQYSREEHYHVILPIYPSAGVGAVEHGLLVDEQAWCGVLVDRERVLLMIPTTHSVWYPEDVERETEYVVDEGSLAEIDRRLCAYFSLPLED